ncbi:MAG: inositol 2-dehydrogenase, partial [Anaerolineae bacterium]
VGIIGLGRMGSIYADCLARRTAGAELVAVADIRPELAEKTARTYGLPRWYSDFREMLEKEEVQAVVIASPTSTHREVIIQVAQAGKDIFCEKPLALTLEDTDAALEAVKEAGVKLQVGFMRRFDSGYAAAKKKIDEGAIGHPVTFKSIGRDPFCPKLEYADPKVSGGLILDMAIHDFDLARWLMGSEVKRVYSEGGTLVFKQLCTVGDIDNATVNIIFENGAIGNVEVSRNALYGYDIRTEVLGSEGALMIGYFQQTPLLVLTKKGICHDMVPYIIERFGHAYQAQIQHFVDCLQESREPSVRGMDGRAALEIGIAATRSFYEGRPVELPLAE